MPASISSYPKGTLKQATMLTAYRALGCILLPALPIALYIRSKKQIGYRQRMLERFGLVKEIRDRKTIVIHGASLGEITALKPIIEQCLASFPDYHILVTSFTPAGSTKVTQLFGSSVSHCYLPFDIWPCVKAFIKRVQPVMMIFMETEIWPNLIHQAFQQDIALVLINARISDKALPKYQKNAALITPSLQRFNQIVCQSAVNLDRFLALGANKKALSISGNLKLDAEPVAVNASIKLIQSTINDRPTWLIASSHSDEEPLLLAVLCRLRQALPNLLCIWAPRHIERFDSVNELCQAHHLKVSRRSKAEPLTSDTAILLIDTIGELAQFYHIASISTVCGSFNNTGGHNPLEPLLQQSVVTFGPNMVNTQELVAALLDSDAAYQHKQCDSEMISREILNILSSKSQQSAYIESATEFLAKHRGSVAKTMESIKQLLNQHKIDD